MADLYLNPLTGDLVITDDLRFTQGIESVVQRIELRLSAVKGEWRYDLDYGIDYYGEILVVKGITEAKIAAIFRKTLIETEGVDKVTKMIVGSNTITRVYTVDWQVLALGEYIDGSRDI